MVVVKNLKTTLLIIGGVKMLPGINEVEPEFFEKHKKDFNFFKANKFLEVVKKQSVGSKISKSNPDKSVLESMNSGEAVDLIEETVNSELLEKWNESESRKTVKKAIKKQLEKLGEYIDKGKGSKKLRAQMSNSESEE